jgi:organic hydroperoxide reductase OsmC/OhrA
MITYPITFEGSALATEGIMSSWQTKATDTHLSCSVPKEFEGSSENASPEDYFLLAVMNCFVATFKVYASYSKVAFNELKVAAKLIVDKNQDGKPCMRKVEMDVQLSGISNPARARLLVDKVLANGFILQSVKSELVANLTVSE